MFKLFLAQRVALAESEVLRYQCSDLFLNFSWFRFGFNSIRRRQLFYVQDIGVLNRIRDFVSGPCPRTIRMFCVSIGTLARRQSCRCVWFLINDCDNFTITALATRGC